MMYTDCTTEGISTPSACNTNIMMIFLLSYFCKGMRRIKPLSEMIRAANNICIKLLCIVLETKVPRMEENKFALIPFITNWQMCESASVSAAL